jgi:hypothetical protein
MSSSQVISHLERAKLKNSKVKMGTGSIVDNKKQGLYMSIMSEDADVVRDIKKQTY